MERLIHSSSSLLSKPFLKPAHSPHRLSRNDALPFRLSFLKRPYFVQLGSAFCALENSSSSSSSSSFRRLKFHAHCSKKGPSFSSSPDPDVSSTPGSHFLKRIVGAASNQQKVITAGAVLLVSALFVLLVHPIITSSAYATGFSAASAVNGKIVRTELLSSAWTGFFAGCLHTLSGPDHLAALAPLSIGRTRVESALVGALWGCGHDAGQLIFGLLFLLLKDRLHIEILRTWGTRVVGFTLLVIGAMGIREASESPAPYALMIILPALALPSRIAGSCSQALKERVPRVTEKLTWASSLVAIALGLAIIFSQFFGFSLY
ncbi:unnamed protein product, partial [Vitis vinifera]